VFVKRAGRVPARFFLYHYFSITMVQPLVVVKRNWFYILGVMLLAWALVNTTWLLNNRTNQDNLVVLDQGFVPFSAPHDGAAAGLTAPMVADVPQYQPAYQGVLRSAGGMALKGAWMDEMAGIPAVSAQPIVLPAQPPVTDTDPKITPETPQRIVIKAIHLDAPIIPAAQRKVTVDGVAYDQWAAPDEFAIGWHTTSARLGETGNTVLNGHHNEYGEVFRYIVYLVPGDTIDIYGEKYVYRYVVVNKMVLPERGESAEIRMENARWIMPSEDERLTLITCWPYESNTHRLILVARPLGKPEPIAASQIT
jgi:LPXTG-site transpeptidase (sortase) family protein